MLATLRAKDELNAIAAVQGFCDHPDDQRHFAPAAFDVILCRQLVNCLFDPIAAFRNWSFWLKDHGTVIVMDGLFDRSDWAGRWQEEIDQLPLSACRTTATFPYLLEQTGFRIDFVDFMAATNARPSTRTKRYMVVASKLA